MRSACPIANALDIIGDKWTLLIVRDMLLFGHSRFSEFLRADEGIPSNILADRLKRLEEHGLVRRRRYQQRPERFAYMLTQDGRELEPILREMICWGLARAGGGEPERHP